VRDIKALENFLLESAEQTAALTQRIRQLQLECLELSIPGTTQRMNAGIGRAQNITNGIASSLMLAKYELGKIGDHK
jgi:hypothetical protein